MAAPNFVWTIFRLTPSLAAEYEDVPVRIAYLEFDVAVRLFLERHYHKRLSLNRLIDLAHALRAEVGVPEPLRPSRTKIGLLIIDESKQHDFGAVSLQARVRVGLPCGKVPG